MIGAIGSGLDIVYPPENKELFSDVASHGAIVSEYAPGVQPLPAHFPMRNRLLSGLALGVAVIEAPKKSGALITATRALEQGRDVFAMPGNVDAVSCEGSNALLRDGAIPVLSADDIVDEYAELFPDNIVDDTEDNAGGGGGGAAMQSGGGKKVIDNATVVDYIDFDKILRSLSGDERAVAEAIGGRAVCIDEIITRSGLPASQVLSALTLLEIKGCAVRGSNQDFSLKNPE